jgi:hypothetical protein
MMRNRAKCKNCLDIIESKHRHDWVSCSCFSNDGDTTGIYIDGGQDYCRIGGKLENVLRLNEQDEEIPLKLD